MPVSLQRLLGAKPALRHSEITDRLISVGCSLGVIGLGRMAQALLLPLLEQGSWPPSEVIAVVGRSSTASRLVSELPDGLTVVEAADASASSAWEGSLQLLAIKPHQLDAVAATAPPVGSGDPPLLISVLAGVTLARLEQAFPGRVCVRAVPNTPSLVRAGLTGLAWGSGITDQHRQQVQHHARNQHHEKMGRSHKFFVKTWSEKLAFWQKMCSKIKERKIFFSP